LFMLLTCLFNMSSVDISTTRLLGHLKWRLVEPKNGKLRNVITHNAILAIQKTESYVFTWQRAHLSFQVTCVSAFARRHFKRSVDTLVTEMMTGNYNVCHLLTCSLDITLILEPAKYIDTCSKMHRSIDK